MNEQQIAELENLRSDNKHYRRQLAEQDKKIAELMEQVRQLQEKNTSLHLKLSQATQPT